MATVAAPPPLPLPSTTHQATLRPAVRRPRPSSTLISPTSAALPIRATGMPSPALPQPTELQPSTSSISPAPAASVVASVATASSTDVTTVDYDVPAWVDSFIYTVTRVPFSNAVDSVPHPSASSQTDLVDGIERNRLENGQSSSSQNHNSHAEHPQSSPIDIVRPEVSDVRPADSPPSSRTRHLADNAVLKAPSMNDLVARAAVATGVDRTRLALQIIRDPQAPSLAPLASRRDVPTSVVSMLTGPSALVFVDPIDRASVIVAAHTLCNYALFQNAFINAGGLVSLCTILRPALAQQRVSSSDRITGNSGVFFTPGKTDANHNPGPSFDSDSTLSLHATENLAERDSSSHTLPGGIHKVVWNAAIRTIAKLMVVSPFACAFALSTGALALLARAARPGEPMDIRLRAAAGLAAIAAWSGPRRAVDIVHTDDVVLSMTAILAENDERIPTDLRVATIDGLVVMSFRRHARGVLQRYGAEEKIKAAARFATMSGDYTTAARSTVAAGHLAGRSVDEYGFLVQDEMEDSTLLSDGADSAPETSSEHAVGPILRRRPTGLQQIQQRLLDEPYTSVEDPTVLEKIVHEDAGVLSSSPRDRDFARKAAKVYGVSTDEIEFISLLEEEASPSKREEGVGSASKDTDGAAKRVPSSLQGAPDELSVLPRQGDPVNDPVNGTNDMSDVQKQSSGSVHRISANFSMQDPDFDRALRNEEYEEVPSSSTLASSRSKKLSPLLAFSSATNKAAERDRKRIVKTNSQQSRDAECERIWKDVLDNKPEKLKRESGRSNRVEGYRELALIPVPPYLRRRLWPILLDTVSLRKRDQGLYQRLCTELETSTMTDDIEHTIEADVTRTMPLHSLFWAGGAQVGVQSLRSILRAYAKHVPEIGYCQGMSSIAAVFLMNATDEEEAFLMMVQFMSRFQYTRIFAPGFPLMLQWIDELKPLIAHYMPELNAHLGTENVPLELYADKWLITALSHNFPHRHLLRVWDLMFLGGSPKIILKACLMVLKECESRLLKMDFERILSLLQREFADNNCGVLDVMNPEPFISKMRDFRFMPDIKKATGGSVAHNLSKESKNAAAAPDRKGERVRRNGLVSGCLGCFKRSATID